MFWIFGKNSWKSKDPELYRRIKELKKESKSTGGLVELVLEPDFNREFCKLDKYSMAESGLNDTLSILYVTSEKKQFIRQIATVCYHILPKGYVHLNFDKFSQRYVNASPCLKGVAQADRRRIEDEAYLITSKNAKLMLERQIVDVAEKMEGEGLNISIKGTYLNSLYEFGEMRARQKDDPVGFELDKMHNEDGSALDKFDIIYMTGNKLFSQRTREIKARAEKAKIEPGIEILIFSTSPEDI